MNQPGGGSSFPCTLCGYGELNEEWLRRFRVVYHDGVKASVSGVGVNAYHYQQSGAVFDIEFAAPSSPDGFYDPRNGVGLLDEESVGVIRQNYQQGRTRGFPFHEACWLVLSKVFPGRQVPVTALYDVCRSLPTNRWADADLKALVWGHNYGGLYTTTSEKQPWEPCVLDGFADLDQGSPLYPGTDPFDLPHLRLLVSILAATTVDDTSFQPLPNLRTRSTGGGDDCFNKLPFEVVSEIACLLSLEEFLQSRLASRAFVAHFYDQQFWKSRFGPDGVFSWVFEAAPKKLLSWVKLYRVLQHKLRASPKMYANRTRVWDLAQGLRPLLLLQKPAQMSPSVEVASKADGKLKWTTATADIRDHTPERAYRCFFVGCRLLHEQEVRIPDGIQRIYVSVVQVGSMVYVAGMELVTRTGNRTQIGYGALDSVISVAVPSTKLVGFNMAIGTGGVHGIQCVFGDDSMSSWIGSRKDTPITRRLALSSPIVALRAGFDGFKIVSLGVATHETSLEPSRSLRNSALWYPDVPGAKLCLNEAFLSAPELPMQHYQPLSWLHFGGPGGKDLSKLVAISASDGPGLRCIDFHFLQRDGHESCISLGNPQAGGGRKRTFRIHGQRGESLVELHTWVRNFDNVDEADQPERLRQGGMYKVQFSTNCRASRVFGFVPYASEDETTERCLRVGPGTAITGLYISQVAEYIVSLGVITEPWET